MSVQDELEINRAVNLYGFAVDTQSWDLFDRIFTDDIDADYSETSHWTDLATFKSDFEAYHDAFDGTQHTMMSHLVNVRGDIANAMTYATWRLVRRGLAGGDFWEGQGWYDDVLTRTNAGWRISSRICRIVWWGGNPLVNETIPGVKFSLPLEALRAERLAGRVRFYDSLMA